MHTLQVVYNELYDSKKQSIYIDKINQYVIDNDYPGDIYYDAMLERDKKIMLNIVSELERGNVDFALQKTTKLRILQREFLANLMMDS